VRATQHGRRDDAEPRVQRPLPHLTRRKFRHRDHRFEWTRAEFHAWAEYVAERYGYTARFLPIGPDDPAVGSPTQMVVFTERAQIA
jgi:hypothetical protein